MNKHKPAPKQLRPGGGENPTLLGEPRVIKVLPSENEAYLQFETSHAPGMAILPFMLTGTRTRRSTFYVLTGEYEFVVGAEK
jgi:hypothetical protein